MRSMVRALSPVMEVRSIAIKQKYTDSNEGIRNLRKRLNF